jgi:hypothetical protein
MMQEINNRNRLVKIIATLFFIIVVVLMVKSVILKNNLKSNFEITNAQVTSYDFAYRGGLKLSYTFPANGKSYSYTRTFLDLKTSAANNFINKFFPVVYSLDNIESHELLVTEERFKKYKVTFPDSLFWVTKYLNQ